ncbi:MAG: hypothetical protein IJV70_02425 [Clostridia bacterium]|nr:hypothetical protein [Clostridia bacterium]
MYEIIMSFLYFSIPLLAFVFFGVSLYKYLKAKKANKRSPGTFPDQEIKNRKTVLIVASVIAGVLIAILLGFIGLLFLAVAYM